MRPFLSQGLLFLLLALPGSAAAVADQGRWIQAPGLDIENLFVVLQQLVTLGVVWIGPLCLTMFLIGAFVTVAGAGKEEHAKRGKTIMVGSLIGLAIVLLSYTIIKAIYFVIY